VTEKERIRARREGKRGAVLRKRIAKLAARQEYLLHELAGVYGSDYHGILADCAARMRQCGMVPDPRLDEALMKAVMES
jgi:hypothetical protein